MRHLAPLVLLAFGVAGWFHAPSAVARVPAGHVLVLRLVSPGPLVVPACPTGAAPAEVTFRGQVLADEGRRFELGRAYRFSFDPCRHFTGGGPFARGALFRVTYIIAGEQLMNIFWRFADSVEGPCRGLGSRLVCGPANRRSPTP